MEFLTDPFLVDPATMKGPVLVTGAGGCIGAWTMAILSRSGVPVVGFDLSEHRRRPALLLGEAQAAALTWETGDITDGQVLHRIVERHGIGSIIHLAGLQVPFCKADPALGARVNVVGTINVLEAARAFGLKRLAYASSTAALGMPPGGPVIATLYGAYKQANEYSAQMYWLDWKVPSVGIRPNVVYGVGRDQGLTSGFTVALARAVQGQAHDIGYSGPIGWLYAGEAAAGFVAAIARDGDGAPVFNQNGGTDTIEAGLEVLTEVRPTHAITASGSPLPVPLDLDDGPLQRHVGGYATMPLRDGIYATLRAFELLEAAGRLQATA